MRAPAYSPIWIQEPIEHKQWATTGNVVGLLSLLLTTGAFCSPLLATAV